MSIQVSCAQHIVSAGLIFGWLACVVVLGCSQRPLDALLAEQATTAQGNSDQDAASAVSIDPVTFFPLVDGARWTYAHSDPKQGIHHETTRLVQALDGTRTVYDVGTSRDDSDELETQRWSWEGPRLLQRRSEKRRAGALTLQTEYAPGYSRLNLDWNQPGMTDKVAYTRIETDAAGTVTRTEHSQVFRVLAVDAEIEVPFGRMAPCLLVERTSDGDRSLLWFARNLGRVRELDDKTQVVEELTDVSRE